MAEISYPGGRLPDLSTAPETSAPPARPGRTKAGRTAPRRGGDRRAEARRQRQRSQLGETLKKNVIEKIHFKRVLQYALFLFLALLTQNMLLTQMRFAGVCPMILPAVAVAAGMFQGASWGAVIALVLGLFADMAYVENAVLFTVLFPVLAFASGFVSQFFINRRVVAFMGVALLAFLLTGVAQMLHVVVRDSFAMGMLDTVFLQTLWALPFAPLAYLPAAHWIE